VGPPPPQQHQQPGSSSNGNGTVKQSLWQKPFKMLDSAMQKMAAETGSQCGGCGKWLGMTPGYVRALGQQWHPHCFRCGFAAVLQFSCNGVTYSAAIQVEAALGDMR
jgi:hypothetical protein